MVLTGIDAIKKYKTRTATAEIEEDGEVVARVDFSRLPIEELVGYLSLFEGVDPNDSMALFNREKIERLFQYMTNSLLSANPDVSEDDAKDFVGTNFMNLVEPFMKANGADVSVSVPDDVKKQLDELDG